MATYVVNYVYPVCVSLHHITISLYYTLSHRVLWLGIIYTQEAMEHISTLVPQQVNDPILD